jgi:delta(3,5)-delta(2,4)-dienoyl-CoA isomerase
MQTAFTSIETFPVPVVAAIHGACIGAGIDLTCCTDVRVCSPTAKFSIREVRLGLAADVGTLQRFPKLVGFTSRVRELCFTGDDFTAQEALTLGFVSRISSTNDSLMDTANDICERICRNSPIAVTITKSSLNYSRDHSVSDGLEHIALHNSTALQSDDLVKSFMSRGGGGAPEFSPLHSHARL